MRQYRTVDWSEREVSWDPASVLADIQWRVSLPARIREEINSTRISPDPGFNLALNVTNIGNCLRILTEKYPDYLTPPVLVDLLARCTDPSLDRVREALLGLLAKASSGVPLVGDL